MEIYKLGNITNKRYKIDEICEIISGKGPKGVKNLNNYKIVNNQNTNFINWLLIKNIKKGQFVGDFEKYNLDETTHKLVKFNINSIVLSMYASPGEVVINDRYENLYINQSFCKIIPDQSKIILKYLFFYLIANKNEILKMASGTTQKNLNIGKVKSLKLDIPILEFQKQIIDIIEPLEKIIDLKKQSLINFEFKIKFYINYFFKLNSNVEFNKYKLGDICKLKSGNSKITEKYIKNNPGEYRVVSASGKNNGIYGYINTYDFENGVTIAKDGNNAGTIFYQSKPFTLNCHAITLIVKEKQKILDKFLFFYLKNKEKNIKKITSGSTRPSLSLKTISDFEIKFPYIETQKKIIDIIEPLDQKFKLLEKEISIYEIKYKYYLNLLLESRH